MKNKSLFGIKHLKLLLLIHFCYRMTIRYYKITYCCKTTYYSWQRKHITNENNQHITINQNNHTRITNQIQPMTTTKL